MCAFLFGGKKRGGTWPQAAEAMSEVAVIFEQQLDTYTTHEAGVLVRPSEDQSATQLKAEIERAMTATDRTKIRYDVETDDTSHAWLVLRESSQRLRKLK